MFGSSEVSGILEESPAGSNSVVDRPAAGSNSVVDRPAAGFVFMEAGQWRQTLTGTRVHLSQGFCSIK